MPVYNADYWRNRAKDYREKADILAEAETREMLMRVAVAYDRLAEHAEAQLCS